VYQLRTSAGTNAPAHWVPLRPSRGKHVGQAGVSGESPPWSETWDGLVFARHAKGSYRSTVEAVVCAPKKNACELERRGSSGVAREVLCHEPLELTHNRRRRCGRQDQAHGMIGAL